MKKVFALLLLLTLVLAAFAACDKNEEPPHEHSFDSVWLYDATQHWHAATCEHAELESDRGDHVDADGNDICDVCGYIADHTHSYDEGWTWNESTHWHKSACGHNVKDGEAKHADENNDAICDVCTYDYDHAHTYDEAWVSVGENGHWHAPTCGHSVDGIELTPHADGNNDGACDTCGENGGHEHTYAESWTTTEDEHWKDVTCGHDVPVTEKGVHADENGDTTCDTCGYTPPHFHTFADTLSSDGANHWYASTCGHDVKKDEMAHSGHEEDGVCDVCAHVVFHLYTVTVTAPEYVTVITPDGIESNTFILKENTPATFTLRVPTYAEVVSVAGAKQEGKPTPDGEYNIYTVKLNGITADTAVTVVGNKLSAVEMIVSDGKGSLTIVGSFKYAYEDITFTAPTAGRYMIFSTSHDEVGFGLGKMGEDGYPIYDQVYFMDITQPCDFTVQARYFPWSVPEGGKLDYTYIVAKVDSEITLGSLKAEGYTLPTNSDVTVKFTVPKAGRYQISSSTLGLVWNDYVCDSIVVTATEDNQEMSFKVRYENTSVPYFSFDCNIVSMEAESLKEGDNTVTAPYGSYYAISVTATQAGSYMVQALNPFVDFYLWNENTSSMNGQGSSYTKTNMKKGEKIVLYVTVDIYDYDGTDDITDIIRISYLGYVPTMNGDTCNAQVGATNSFINDGETSDFTLSVSGGDQISVDGGATWHTELEVNIPAGGSVSYTVQSASGADTVSVTVKRIAYEFDLYVGTQTQTMIPGKEYTVTLSGSADPAFYVDYILSWTDKNVVASYNGQILKPGATVMGYTDGYTLILVYNGSAPAEIQFTLADPYLGGTGDSTGENLQIGYNAIDVTVENFYCAGTTVTFTAPATGTFCLSAANGETNAEIFRLDGDVHEAVTLPYTFTAEKGESITFLVTTTAFMTLTEDVIDLDLARIPAGEDKTALLNGTYNVNFLVDGMYVLTFKNGILSVVDNNNGKESGDYRYFYTEADGVVVTNTDGTSCAIEIAIDADRNMTFKCAGLAVIQPLIPA